MSEDRAFIATFPSGDTRWTIERADGSLEMNYDEERYRLLYGKTLDWHQEWKALWHKTEEWLLQELRRRSQNT